MYYWFFIGAVLLNLVISEDEYPFRKSPIELAECIEDHELFKKNSYYKNAEAIQALVDRVAEQFSGTSKDSINHINSNIDFLIYLIRKEKNFHGLKNAEVFWAKLKIDIVTALIFCSDGPDESRSSTKVLLTIPFFNGEQPHLAAVLDYMLVDWTNRLRDMLLNINDRVCIWQYVDQCLITLSRALNLVQSPEYFRNTIRVMFNRRAFYNFDGLHSELPFITYIFVRDALAPHVDPGLLRIIISYNRSARNFSERNPVVSNDIVRSILEIHAEDPDLHHRRDNNDIFERYRNYGMRYSEFYLEVRINQFYRLIFLRLEMMIRGLSTNGFIPENLLAIVYNNERYRDYLLETRRTIVRYGDARNPLVQNLGRNSRVIEESLFLFLLQYTSDRGLDNTVTTTTSTTTLSSITTTEESNKKNDFGGYSFSPDEIFPDSCCRSSDENEKSHSMDFSNFFSYDSISQCLLQKFDYAVINSMNNVSVVCSIISNKYNLKRKLYGYLDFIGDPGEKVSPKEELSLFLDAMDNVFADSSLLRDIKEL